MMSSSFKLVEIGYSNIMRHCCLVYTVFIRGLFFYFYSLIICHWILFFLTLLSRPNSQRYAPGFSFYFILKKEEDGWYIIIRRFPNSQVLFFFLFNFYSSVVAGFLFLALLNQRERRQGIYIECRTYIYQPNKKRVELNLILIQTKKKEGKKQESARVFKGYCSCYIIIGAGKRYFSATIITSDYYKFGLCVFFWRRPPNVVAPFISLQEAKLLLVGIDSIYYTTNNNNKRQRKLLLLLLLRCLCTEKERAASKRRKR